MSKGGEWKINCLTKQTVLQTLTKVELGSGGLYFCVTGDMGGGKRT